MHLQDWSELYSMVEDPQETSNLARQPEYDQVASLKDYKIS